MPNSPAPGQATRRSFALTGRSRAFDTRTQAVRPDIADVRLADQVFAPHYAAPMPMVVKIAAPLAARGAPDAEVLTQMEPGDVFEALDFAGGFAWGIAPGKNLVGYLPLKALGREAA